MKTVSLTLDEIYNLAKKTLLANGCDDETASILAELIMKAERDGSLSHGLFRLPAYVSGLKSGKINGKGKPEVKKISPAKINLYLEIINKRSDGYHNLESLMSFCDFGDVISVKKSNVFQLDIVGQFSKNLISKDNIIVETIEKLQDFLNIGGEDILGDPRAIILIEWGDKLESILPPDAIRISFQRVLDVENERLISIKGLKL